LIRATRDRWLLVQRPALRCVATAVDRGVSCGGVNFFHPYAMAVASNGNVAFIASTQYSFELPR
jgi:hypothetical protein